MHSNHYLGIETRQRYNRQKVSNRAISLVSIHAEVLNKDQ